MTRDHPQPIDSGSPVPPRRLVRGADKLVGLIGRRLLVGISYVDGDGEVISRQQFCGEVLDVGDGVVVVERPGAEEPAVLPADADAYRPASAGRYQLAGTGEIVTDPDYVTTWRVLAANP
jgi:hypothetical protein